MHERSALGPADVPDEVLARMVAGLLEVDEAVVVSSVADEVAYDIPSITTAGRYWVRGRATVDGDAREFAFFVKHVQEWSRSPFFAFVPEDAREWARLSVPWRTEGEVYRSDLAARLPNGLAMPRALGVHEIDESSYSVWLEVLPTAAVTWDLDRYREAARLLGRFAGSSQVRELATVGGHPFDVTFYVDGRLAHQVLPLLHAADVWRHPLVADAFGDLRGRLLDAADRVPAITAELMQCPTLVGHGDACPNNLLVVPGRDGFTMIDFGFLAPLPVGFDLGQLLVGDVQVGRHGADDLSARDEACVAAYHQGLLDEGLEIDVAAVRRAHALHLMLFTGLSTVPFEHLDAEPTPELRAVARTRAEIARFSLDLLDGTA